MAHGVDERPREQDADMLAQLANALSAASPSIRDAGRALTAYAVLEPRGCLDFMARNHPQLLGLLDRAALSRILDSALQSLPRSEEAADSKILRALADGYRDTLSPASLLALVGRFPQDIPGELARAVESGLSRSANDATLLRAAIALAQRRGDLAAADRLSTALGLADSTPATVASILRGRRPDVTPGAPVRLAILSTYTVDHLVPFVDLECRALGLAPHIYVSPFNSWAQDVIAPSSALRRFEPEITFLAVSIDDLLPNLSEPIEGEELTHHGEAALERLLGVVRAYVGWAGEGRPIVVHAFHSAFETGPLGIADDRDGHGRRDWLSDLNLRLARALEGTPGAYLLDVREAVARSGVAFADNAKLRHVAAMRLSPPTLGPVAKAYARYIAPLKGLTKKCVVLDLDNTLWGGVVGEDGKDGIRLGHTSPGSEFVEFQHFLAGLSRRGILLALNSKNNPEDALDAIGTHEAMVLREAAFSAVRINWLPKPENMTSIARELNIGLDSMVFVDDNPDEREMMRRTLPEVLTVELPKDPAMYRHLLENLPQLQVLTITDEDRIRATQYRTARLREDVKLSAASMSDYLHSLQIEATISLAAKPIFGRIVQLFARTNQFNTTARRYAAGDIERFAGDASWRLYVLSSKDRFGEHGIVALGLVRIEGEAWTIDSFLMSCRVIGYGIETALLSFISEEAVGSGARWLRGEFVPTPKNAPALGLFSGHGFSAVESPDSVEHWERSLSAGPLASPPWVDRRFS